MSSALSAMLRPFRRMILRALVIAPLLFGGSAAFACDVTTPTSVTLGTYSPAAIKAQAVPNTKTSGGFSCSSYSVLALLTGNFLKATVASAATMKLASATTSSEMTFKLFADEAGTAELKPGTETYYMNGTVLNLLNLLGNGAIDVPVFFKIASTDLIAPGTYTGSFSIKWDWYFCSGIGLLGLCIGTPDQGSKTTVVNVTVVAEPKPLIVALDFGATTWDPVNGTNRPKAIPGGKRRMRVTLTNPDIIPIEANSLQIVVPTPAGMTVALEGDGASLGSAVTTSDGTPSSALSLIYTAPASTTDQVDFSADAGASWTYAPVAGDGASQGSVNRVRFRPSGAMTPQSTFAISLPYALK